MSTTRIRSVERSICPIAAVCRAYCCRDIKPQINSLYPGCKLDLKGYMTSSVTWPHDSLYFISYRYFLDPDTNSKYPEL